MPVFGGGLREKEKGLLVIIPAGPERCSRKVAGVWVEAGDAGLVPRAPWAGDHPVAARLQAVLEVEHPATTAAWPGQYAALIPAAHLRPDKHMAAWSGAAQGGNEAADHDAHYRIRPPST